MSSVTDIISAILPNRLYPVVYTVFTRIHPDRDPVSYSRMNGCYRVRNLQTNEMIYVPDAKYLYRVQSESSPSFQARLESKYTLDGFAEVENDDIVVDCGAHVGGFSLAVADRAGHVLAVEPDPRLQHVLSLMIDDVDSISLYDVALSDDSGSVEFRLSENPSENSLIDVDSDDETDRITVQSMTLKDFIDSTEYNSIDFLKIDAEGAEPEVLRGLGMLRPRVVAVDAGPERRGERTLDEVLDVLDAAGYETRIEGDRVFGRYRE